jgi:alpha,alpha-trehalase
VLADFAALGSNITEGSITDFVDSDFRGEGLELEAFSLPNFNQQPAFLTTVRDPLLKAFSQIVHGYWTQLIRATNDSTLCISGSGCESSLIPLNHTFVVPGGRFREQCERDLFAQITDLTIVDRRLLGHFLGY